MRILVTGNLGYVGSQVCPVLAKIPGAEIIGVDLGLFENSVLRSPEKSHRSYVETQIHSDIRDLTESTFKGIDAVVHLAAISNDPMGEEFSEATYEINLAATQRVAELAQSSGVEHFIFASSCSVYGEGGAHPRTELDSVNPLTAYAISKIEMEKRLASLPGNMKTTSLRFATACGPSLALRTDLVLNDFVWSALASGKVEILSDGSPWRPLIDVRDMAKVISWMITNREASSDRHLVVNAGSNAANYQVKEIAETVANSLPGTVLKINTDASPDRRSYKVDFTKFERLTNGAVEFYSLKESTQALVELISSQGFDLSKFDMNTLKRLSIIRALKSSGSLSSLLRWTKN